MMKDKTLAWQRLEAGKAFNNRLDPPYYDMVDVNWEMYKGNQYVNSNTSDNFPKPVMNVIKRIINFFVAMLTSSPVSITFSQIAKSDEEGLSEVDLEVLNEEFKNFAERNKLQSLVRDSYKDAAITGDFAWHLYFDTDKKPFNGMYGEAEGEICVDLVDGVNVYFGNPNNKDIESQPYILITGRDMIKDLQQEYDDHNSDKEELQADNDTEYQAGLDSRIEIEDLDGSGKATYVIMYEKKRVTVKDEQGNKVKKTKIFVTKSIGTVDIYKDVDTGLSKYPIIFENWERLKNNYHGLALCTTIIPNQIFINRMFAMAMLNLTHTAFPKAVYDKNRITSWTNSVNSAIPVDLMPGENIKSIAGYLEAGTMSPQIIQMINLAWDYTKESLGSTDSMLGNVNPEQASGAAISVTAKQSAIPLTIPRDNMYDALECMGNIFVDMIGAYYNVRPVPVETEDGSTQVVMFDFNKFKTVYTKTKVDVGATTPYDEMADRLTMENFLRDGHITFKQLLESYPNIFPNAHEILKEIKEAESVNDQALISQLTPEQQAQFMQLPPEQQEQMLKEFKGVQANVMQPM